jgi:uncharacterized membrane protein YidH (DUF202 family)
LEGALILALILVLVASLLMLLDFHSVMRHEETLPFVVPASVLSLSLALTIVSVC